MFVLKGHCLQLCSAILKGMGKCLKLFLVTRPLHGPYFDLPGFDLDEKMPLFPKVNLCKFLCEHKHKSLHKFKICIIDVIPIRAFASQCYVSV